MSCLSFLPLFLSFVFYQLKETSESCLECENVVVCSDGAEEEITKTVARMAVA